jgi:hypothetical protein
MRIFNLRDYLLDTLLYVYAECITGWKIRRVYFAQVCSGTGGTELAAGAERLTVGALKGAAGRSGRGENNKCNRSDWF